MGTPLRVLIVEDSEDDALLVLCELRRGGYAPISTRVDTPEAMAAELERETWDIVISDYVMPRFTGLEALKLMLKKGLDLPFIVTSGKADEETLVGAMKAGGNDYIMKNNLSRLVPAVERELREAAVRREKKKAEEVLRESEELYRSLFENMLNGFAYCKMLFHQNQPQDFIYLKVNHSFEELTGLKNVIGKKVSEVIPGIRESDPKLFEIYGRVALSGKPERVEIYVEARGAWFWISVYSPGKEYFVAVFDVITERKRAEEALRASYRFLQIAYSHTEISPLLEEFVKEIKNYTGCAAVGIRILDEEGNIPYQTYEGFSQSFFELESPLSIKSDKCMCINVIKGDIDPKLRFYTKGGAFYMNGTTRFLATVSEEEKGKTRNVCNQVGYESVALVPIHSRNHILGLIHVADSREDMVPLYIVEVLEKAAMQLGTGILRKRAEKAMHESEDRYRDLVEHSQDLIYTHDLQGQFLSVNPAVAKLLGYDRSSMLNMNVHDILPSDVPDQFDSYLDTIRRDGAAKGLMLLQTATGERRILEYNNTLRAEGVASPIVRGICHDVTELKQAEQALRENEERYRMLVDTSPDAITLFGLNLNIIMANRPALTLYGHENSEEVKGKSGLDYHVSEERGRVIEDMRKILKTGSIGPVEYTLLKKDGTPFPAELKASLILDDQKKPSAIILVSRDITERKRAEEVLREALERAGWLARLPEENPNPVARVSAEGSVLYRNPAAAELPGWVCEVGKLLPDTLLPLVGKAMTEAQEVRQDVDLSGRFYSVSVMPFLADCYANIYGRDITELKAATEALSRKTALLSGLLDSIPDIVFFKDCAGVYLGGNPEFSRFVGRPRAEIVGRTGYDLFPKERADSFLESDRVVMERGETWGVEQWLDYPDGRRLLVETMKAPLRSANGETIGLIGVSRDITERKLAEERLQRSEEAARGLAQENAVMAEIGRIISSTPNIEEVYERFVAEVRKLIPFDRIAVSLNNPEEGTATITYASGLELGGRKVGDVYPLHHTTNEEVTRTRAGLLVQLEAVEELEGGFSGFIPAFRAGLRSILTVPLIFRDRVIGALRLLSKKNKAYTDRDLSLAERIAAQIAGAIANAQLFLERKRAEEHLKASLKEKEVLLREIHHRVKNNLQVISSLLRLQSRYIEDDAICKVFKESQDRVKTMAIIHEKLYQSTDLARVDFAGYIRDLTANLYRSYGVSQETIGLRIHAKDVFLGINMAIPCGLIINELVSNCLKHAFPGGKRGEVYIDLRSDHDQIILIVGDDGDAFPEGLDFHNAESLGLQLIISLIEQLEGTIELHGDGKTEFRIAFPARHNR